MKNIVCENEVEVQHLPGRDLQWLFTPEQNVSEAFSMNVVVIKPGCTVTPAHSHPEKEEVIYIVDGSGNTLMDIYIMSVKVLRFYFLKNLYICLGIRERWI